MKSAGISLFFAAIASAQNYSAWLNEDVAYIITDQERAAFLRLQTDAERNQFIESFWLRRDPTPDTIDNEFRDEHYRRIAYANDVFAGAIPGWKTDRGRIYILNNNPTQKEPAPEGIRVFVGPLKPPATRFPDLQAKVDSRIIYLFWPMKVRVDLIPVTNATVLAYVTVQFFNKDIQRKQQDGVAPAHIQMFGEFRTPSGWVVQQFEDEQRSPPARSYWPTPSNRTPSGVPEDSLSAAPKSAQESAACSTAMKLSAYLCRRTTWTPRGKLNTRC